MLHLFAHQFKENTILLPQHNWFIYNLHRILNSRSIILRTGNYYQFEMTRSRAHIQNFIYTDTGIYSFKRANSLDQLNTLQSCSASRPSAVCCPTNTPQSTSYPIRPTRPSHSQTDGSNMTRPALQRRLFLVASDGEPLNQTQSGLSSPQAPQ